MNDMDAMAAALKGGIDANSTPAPQMSIDPKTQAVSVVGDPNQIQNNPPRTYKIIFAYPEDELSEDDKLRMVKSETADDEYESTITYENRRVRPIHRTKIAMYVGSIFTAIGLFTEDGSYDSETLSQQSARLFMDHLDELAEMAKLVLDIPESQVKYIRADCLVDFFIDMLHNEPNVIKEAVSFLGASSRINLARIAEKANQASQPNTQQS